MGEGLQDRVGVWGGFLQKVRHIFKTMAPWWDMSNSSLLGQRNHSPVKGWKSCTLERRTWCSLYTNSSFALNTVCVHNAAWKLKRKRPTPNTFAPTLFPGEITSAGLCCFSHNFLPGKLLKPMQHGAPASCHASLLIALFMETGEQKH